MPVAENKEASMQQWWS